MDKKPRRPRRDVNTIAAGILRQATGEEPKRPPPPNERPEPKKREDGEG